MAATCNGQQREGLRRHLGGGQGSALALPRRKAVRALAVVMISAPVSSSQPHWVPAANSVGVTVGGAGIGTDGAGG